LRRSQCNLSNCPSRIDQKFFHRQRRDPGTAPSENQCYRASDLNLTIAAITPWNTVYLSAVAELRVQGEVLPDTLLAHIGPLGWEHISFNGDHVWPSDPFKDGFRPLRNPHSATSMLLSARFGTNSAMIPKGVIREGK
jgi:Tn3 transposase DDE domain